MITKLTKSEKQELDELRRYKEENEANALNRSFLRLEALLEAHHDPIVSIRAFRAICDCLFALKGEIRK